MANFSAGNRIKNMSGMNHPLVANGEECDVHTVQTDYDQYVLCLDHTNENPGCRSFTASVSWVDSCFVLVE